MKKMTQVKGIALLVIPKFIRVKHGEDGLEKWLNSLTPEAQKVYRGIILNLRWYDVKTLLVAPIYKYCEMFHSGNLDVVVELGSFSAEYALNVVFKFLLKLGSPEFLIKKSNIIIEKYYSPIKSEVFEVKEGKASIRITEFEGMDKVNELLMKGWALGSLKVSKAQNPKIEISKSLASNDPYSEFVFTWE